MILISVVSLSFCPQRPLRRRSTKFQLRLARLASELPITTKKGTVRQGTPAGTTSSASFPSKGPQRPLQMPRRMLAKYRTLPGCVCGAEPLLVVCSCPLLLSAQGRVSRTPLRDASSVLQQGLLQKDGIISCGWRLTGVVWTSGGSQPAYCLTQLNVPATTLGFFRRTSHPVPSPLSNRRQQNYPSD